jgi:exonuclease VII small subunit
MAKTKGKAPEEMTYELAFQELQQIVASLESGKMPLDEALKLFERVRRWPTAAASCSSRPSSG